MRAQVLGDLKINGESMISARVRALFARLAVAPGEIVTDDALMASIWPSGPPKSAQTALQTHVGALRDALEPDRARRSNGSFLFRRHGGYMLDLGDGLDASALRYGVEQAENVRSTDASLAVSLLDHVLELWQEPALAEFADDDWALGHVATLREYALRALTLRLELALEAGSHGDAVPRLEAAIATYPYNERLVALLMRALTASGRRRDALEAFQATRNRLVGDLGVEPGPDLRAAERAVLLDGEAPPAAAGAPPATDEPSHFVGRVQLESDLRRHLQQRPLVTLVGPGGVGKTRLARRAAADLARDWGVEVVFVDLTEVASGGAAASIAEALGATPHPNLDLADAIDAAIGRRDILLVLDTCEHLIDSIRVFVDLVLARTVLRVLATSRSPIRHRNELTMDIEPLGTDDAITLLLSRAGLDGSAADRQALGEICRRLDRLPLAIELAAGRLRALTPSQLAELLRRGNAALHGGDDRPLRHRNLGATIAWSYELLDDRYQKTLREISALRGTFTVPTAASFLVIDEPDASRVLLDLQDRSLISRDGSDTLRFRVLDTVRDFALEMVDEHGEGDELHDRHASWVLSSLLNRAVNHEGTTAREINAEIGASLDHFARRESTNELALAVLLGSWWVESSRLSEGRERLDDAFLRHRDAPRILLAPAEALAGLLAWYQGDGHGAHKFFERVQLDIASIGVSAFSPLVRGAFAFVEGRWSDAGAAATELLEAASTPDINRVSALFTAANISWYGGEDNLALSRYTEMRTLAEHLDNTFQHALAARFQAAAAYTNGDPNRAWALAERALALAYDEGDLVSRAQAHAISALVSLGVDDVDEASRHALEAASSSRANFDAFSLRVALPVLAATSARQGDDLRAATCLGWLSHMLAGNRLFLAPVPAQLVAETADRLAERTSELAASRVAARAAELDLTALIRELDVES